jgi:Domain of unknown function (DUF4760)
VAHDPNWADIVTALATAALVIVGFLGLFGIADARRAKNALAAEGLKRSMQYGMPLQMEPMNWANWANWANEPNGLMQRMTELRAKGDPENLELRGQLNSLEDVAILVKHRQLSFSVVRDLLGTVIVNGWSLWEPTVLKLRADLGDEHLYENLEALAKRMQKKLGSPVHSLG